MPILLGLLGSMLLGISDFLGARSSGRSTALQSTTAAFFGGIFSAALLSPFLGEPIARDLLLGAASGVALCIGLTLLWQGYAKSSLGVAAPATAVVMTVLPVIFDAVRGEGPHLIGWCGVGVGIFALILTSWVADSEHMTIGITYGVMSGVAFSVMFVVAIETSNESGTWPIVTQRATAFAIAACVGLGLRRRPVSGGPAMRWSLLAGAIGTTGVAAIVFGGQRGSLTQVIVSGSMYPAVAIGLGWMFMHEKLRRRQVFGLVAALAGIVLIALD